MTGFFICKPLLYLSRMKLTITTNDCLTSDGYYKAIEKAFSFTNRWATDVAAKNGRIDAKREGYPVRFSINGFTPRDYQDLMYGSKIICICELAALPVPVNLSPSSL